MERPVKREAIGIAILSVTLAAALCAGCSGSGERALNIVGSTSVAPFAEMLAQSYQKKFPERGVDVQGGGSTAGLMAVTNGLADIGTCSRSLSPEEAKQFTAIVIARDGLAVVVHPSNPVRGLTTEQIRKLFCGQIRNWKEIQGGADVPVWPITREEGSGTRESFVSLVMKKDRISDRALVQESNGAVKELVKGIKGGIGYMSLGLVGQEVKPLDIDGASPTAANVLSGGYPLARPFLVVTKGAPSPAASQFIDYVL
jgi:phosphate transport system substrate-binding protein